jgi:CheY-like chemotaxis protein
VQIAHDGPTGLDQAKKSKPEIVLLDIGLPGMDGYQVAAHLRREEAVKDVTLIAISGYGQEEDRRLAKEAGFDHHLVKPIASDDLIKLLRESEG